MQDEKMSFIGIVGNSRTNMAFYMIKSIFIKAGFSPIYSNDNDSIIILKSEKDRQIGLINIMPKDLKSILNLKLNFNIVVYTNIVQEERTDDVILKFFSSLKNVIILNMDESNCMNLLKGNDKALVMTYGLNNKATITASSLDIGNSIAFNYCLQRELLTVFDNKIEPLEFPVNLNLIGKENIYNSLAAISVALCFGLDINTIRETLAEMRGLERNMEKIYDNKFMIIDNKCINPIDYNLTFETVQHLKYKSIILLNGMGIDFGDDNFKKIIDIILNWSSILGIKNVLFYFDKKYKSIEESIEKIFLNTDFSYNVFFSLSDSIRYCLKILNDDDLLLIMGDDILNGSKDILLKELS